MSLLKLLLRSLAYRRLSSVLTALSVALGAGLICLILTLRSEAEEAFSQKNSGFEVIVGAKGSPLQLVLSALYGIGQPQGNFSGADAATIVQDRRVAKALPLVIGDNVRGFRVVGTEKNFTDFEFRKNKPITIRQGRGIEQHYEAVVGFDVAQDLKIAVGDSVIVAHGLTEEGAHQHGVMPVVGILEPALSMIDKSVFTTKETVWHIHFEDYREQQEEALALLEQAEATEGEAAHDHNHDHAEGGHEHSHDHNASAHSNIEEFLEQVGRGEIPADFTSVTGVLIQLKNPAMFDSFVRSVNDKTFAQATIPAIEIRGLFAIVGNIQQLLLGLSLLVVVVSMTGILVAMYNSLNERLQDIAIMRSLGAGRRTVFLLLLAEGTSIAALGAFLGVLFARAGAVAAEQYISKTANIPFTPELWYLFDIYVLGGTIIVAAIATLFPAYKAYSTDVATIL